MNNTTAQHASLRNSSSSSYNTKTEGKGIIPFGKLYNNSKFKIFSELSRGIKRSSDQRVYVKNCDAFSTSCDADKKEIILYHNDLVIRL